MLTLLIIYMIGWVYTYWHDSSILYRMGYSYWNSLLVGVVGGFLWPIRWGHDLVVYYLNKRKQNEKDNH